MPLKVEGTTEVARALDQVADHDFTEANRKVAARMVPVARHLAPVKTGALGASLQAVATKTSASIVSRLDYSVPQEYGAPRHDLLGVHYAERALDQSMDQTEADYLAEVERATKKADLGWG